MAVAVAVCRSAAMSSHFQLDSILAPSWPEKKIDTSVAVEEDRENIPPGQFDIWSSIQSQKPPVQAAAAAAATPPYVHPLMRRSSSLLSEKSLEICTENLGSETGSDGYSSSLSDIEIDSLNSETEEFISSSYYHERVPAKGGLRNTNELVSVNYHCSASRRSPPRSFPPPLPSMSRRDGPCLQMRPHRRDGRLVVEAVHVPSHNYLHAQRNGGRLLLCFIDAAPNVVEETNEQEVIVAEDEEEQVMEEEEEIEDEEEEEEEEEEVEVVDRGTVVEVKVSTQPQQLSGAMKVHRSSLVINKFLGGTPQMSPENPTQCHHQESPTLRRSPSITTTTAATAAVVAASTLLTATSSSDGWNNSNNNNNNNNNNGEISGTDNSKMLFTSKRRNKEELLHHMRRCSQLRRPLFIWEPCYITTSS